jgi:polar amino acid transport system substrate-binding protein
LPVSQRWVLIAVATLVTSPASSQEKMELKYGTDQQGGGPYIYKNDPNNPAAPYVGFEVELANYLAKKLGRTAREVLGEWSTLPELLDKSREGDSGIDIVLNGYEARDDLKQKYAATVPYYVYRLQLVAHKDDESVTGWQDLPARDGRPAKRIGVLEGSVAYDYCRKRYGENAVLPNKDVATMFGLVADRSRIDVTVQDNPACVHYGEHPLYKDKLKLISEGRQPGYYVIYLRKDDKSLLDGINQAIKDGLKDGTLRRIYQKYGVWNADQDWLCKELTGEFPIDDDAPVEKTGTGGSGSIWPLIPELIRAAGMTVLLAITSFPLAMLGGLIIAIGRVYGPSWLAFPFAIFVEVIRGTPLLLQLWFLFFMLPKLIPGLAFDPIYTGILGLAINYAAYEAENYRAGLQSVPKGQMEAALALGMTPFTAIRRVVVPQAVRIVIPAVTNDFIALFKDTSVCSVILIVELTRKYNELYNFNRELVVELAFVTAGLYLLMSYPLSLLARWLERRMGTHTGGTHR